MYIPNRVEILVTVSKALVTSSDTFFAVFFAPSAFPSACIIQHCNEKKSEHFILNIISDEKNLFKLDFQVYTGNTCISKNLMDTVKLACKELKNI